MCKHLPVGLDVSLAAHFFSVHKLVQPKGMSQCRMIVGVGMTVFSRSEWTHSMHGTIGRNRRRVGSKRWRRKSYRRYVEVADYFATGNEE